MKQGEQSNDKIPTDARTFVEIYRNLSKQEAISLRLKIGTALQCSERTVVYWGKGHSKPINLPTKRTVHEVLDRALGIKTTVATLFPEA